MVSKARDINRIPATILAFNEATDEYMDKLGKAMVEEIDKGFDKGQDAMGNPWAPLAASTINRGGNPSILIQDGTLRDSFNYHVDKKDLKVTVGSSDPKVLYHEYGTDTIPKRPIMGPAATWAHEKLITPLGKETIGNRIDPVTF
jgi:Phage virion morphogenesis family.